MKTKTVWVALLAIGLAGGFSAPAADFNADNFDDLVVGIPAKDLGPLAGNAGSVNVLYGSYSYGIANGLQNLTQTSTLIDTAEEDDFFGFALAVGDFNCDGHQDVAIGAKDEDLGSPSIVGAGMVHVVYGSDDGLDPAHSMMVFQGPAILEIPETYDGFGYALAAGDFDRDRCDDLAISAPYEDIGEPPVSGAGIVHVLYGSSSGLSVVGNQIWNQEDLTGLR